MTYSEKSDYAMITVYGDQPEYGMEKAISRAFPDRDLKIITPQGREHLEQAAQNSVLVFLSLSHDEDANYTLARQMQDNRLIVSDIVAFCVDSYVPHPMYVKGRGFDVVLKADDCLLPEFKRFMVQKISRGNRRLAGLVQEEEYRRICDALSSAPASMIVFDADKRAVFVSDHYFRAYPRIAHRLIRGLSVYDAYDMMMREEGISEDDQRFARLQKFWHNLEGSIEFTLDDGTSYRLKAVRLPNRRGIVVMGQNITGFFSRKIQIEEDYKSRLEEFSVLAQTIEKEQTLIFDEITKLLPQGINLPKEIKENIENLNLLLQQMQDSV